MTPAALRRAIAIAATVTLAALGAAGPAAAQEQRATLPDIEDEVMCPICGTTLELSAAPQADRQREFIRGLIADGRSKEEIKDALVVEYGEDVLAVPDDQGFDLAAWVVPILGIGVATAAIVLALLRLSRRRPRPAGPAVDPEQSARIDRDMRSYDL